MSAVVQRERRKTAGQRMTSLVGNAQDEDDAFWGHETWADDASSGNESFRDSDQDSTLRKDEFDSDFNDSETDNEDEEEAAGQQEERELQKQERSNRQGGGKNIYVEQVKPGRGLFHKPKRAMGTGINAGLVLNVPPSMMMMVSNTPTSAPVLSGAPAMPGESPSLPLAPEVSSLTPAPAVASSSSSVPPQGKKSPRRTNELGGTTALVTARQRRSQTKKRDSRNSTPIYSDAPSHISNNNNANNNNTKRPRSSQVGAPPKSSNKRRRYMQEELLVEAVQETEPENQRWLLARKRVQESADQDKDASLAAALREKHRGKNVIQKYHSRRGCLITLTFPDMDSVPELLTRKRGETPNQPERLMCAITGKPAKYRDPKTGKGYFDSAAFKELRRRHDAGVSLDHPRPKSKPKPKEEDTISVNGAAASSVSMMMMNDGKPVAVALSPKPAGFVLDLGGEKKSPGSTRSSGRKWKPSEKMLKGMGITPDDAGVSHSSEKGEELVLAKLPPLPPIKSSSNPVTSAATTGVTISVDATAVASALAVSKPHEEKTERAVVPGVAAHSGTNGTPSSAAETKPSSKGNGGAAARAPTVPSSRAPTLLTPSHLPVPASTPFEQVYIIPGDCDSGSAEPRYVTQSELIMQAISNYNRSTMDSTHKSPQNHNHP